MVIDMEKDLRGVYVMFQEKGVMEGCVSLTYIFHKCKLDKEKQ